MEVPENHWVRLASCMFEDEAAFWWEAALRSTFVDRQFDTITWAEFMEAFNVTYYPDQVREQKAREFSNIQQGTVTVSEFEQKFIQLERFAPGLCATERAQTNKFVWALRFALKDRVASQRPKTLAEAVAIACVAEDVLAEQYGPMNKKDKDKNKNNNGSSSSNNNKTAHTQANNQNNQNNKQNGNGKRKRNEDEKTLPVCPSCKRHHTGECLKSSNKCYACGEAGHIKRNCPKVNDKKDNALVLAKLNAVNARDTQGTT